MFKLPLTIGMILIFSSPAVSQGGRDGAVAEGKFTDPRVSKIIDDFVKRSRNDAWLLYNLTALWADKPGTYRYRNMHAWAEMKPYDGTMADVVKMCGEMFIPTAKGGAWQPFLYFSDMAGHGRGMVRNPTAKRWAGAVSNRADASVRDSIQNVAAELEADNTIINLRCGSHKGEETDGVDYSAALSRVIR